MSWKFRSLMVMTIGVVALLMAGCTSSEVTETRKLLINHVDLQKAANGIYEGEYGYGKFTYVVEVAIQDHRIARISVLMNRDTKRAKMAEGVVGKVMDYQRNDVDVVSGATTTSKALLKAIENAIMKSIP